jgi:hypothetical protein
MVRCIFIKLTSFYNYHIFVRVFLRYLKCVEIYLRGSVENPWVRYCYLKNGRKNGVEKARSSENPWISIDFPKVCGVYSPRLAISRLSFQCVIS